MTKFLLFFLSGQALGLSLHSQSANNKNEGTFLLHKFEQNIGKEKYTFHQNDSGTSYNVEFRFVDRGSAVSLRTFISLDQELRPRSLLIKGKTSRFSSINDSIRIRGSRAYIREGDSIFTKTLGATDFPIAGYSPGTVQMLMLQFWKRKHRPASLNILPSGSVQIRIDGADTVFFNNQNIILDRYIISGVIWGNELAWADQRGQLFCLITNDAEGDKLEMMLEPYESLLPSFIRKSAWYSMQLFAAATHRSVPHAKTIALVGGDIIDVQHSAKIRNGVLIIQDGIIQSIDTGQEIKIPPDAYMIHAEGKTILPGLWDMHAHFEQAEWGPAYLAAGVTSVRDCGNEFGYINAVQEAIDKGNGIGPHILKAGIIDGKGTFALGIIQADSPEEAVRAVRRYKENGFVQIKIYSSIKPPILKAICMEAHRLGLTVTGHIPEGMSLRQAVDSGLDMVNHMEYVTDAMKQDTQNHRIDFSDSSNRALLALLKQHQIVIDPTLGVFEMVLRSLKDSMTGIEPAFYTLPAPLQILFVNMGMPPARSAALKYWLLLMEQTVKALHQEGITIVAGTDMGMPGLSLSRELELYVDSGLTPGEALQTATILPAMVMKRDKEFGSVETGKRGDLIIVDGDPLENIRDIRKVTAVIVDGNIYNPVQLHQMVGFSR